MEPVEDRFTKVAEFTLRLADCLAAIGEKRRGLRREYALFGQESFHPLIRFRFQSMDECERLTVTFSWQALAHHDLKPPFLPRRCVGGLDVSAIDADRAQWIARWQTKFIESRLAGQPMVGLLVEASPDSRHGPAPPGCRASSSRRPPTRATCRFHVVMLVACSSGSTERRMPTDAPYDNRAANCASRYCSSGLVWSPSHRAIGLKLRLPLTDRK